MKSLPIAILALALACLTPTTLADQTTSHPYPGITLIQRTESQPRPQKMHILQINLSTPNLRFKLSPPNPPPNPPTPAAETRGQTTLDFLTQEHAQLAINVHFFDYPLKPDDSTNLTGFAASEGTVYSAFESNPTLNYALLPNSPVLHLDQQNQATIALRGDTDNSLIDATTKKPLTPYTDLSGSTQIITNGTKTIPTNLPTKPNTNPPLHWYTDQITARTAIGLSRDNQTLTLFTIDANNGSEGMSVEELATFLLKEYKIHNALNLDGGGSTTLAIQDPTTKQNHLLNTPTATPRAVGSNLAIFAAPISKSLTTTPTATIPPTTTEQWNSQTTFLLITATLALLAIFTIWRLRTRRPKQS